MSTKDTCLAVSAGWLVRAALLAMRSAELRPSISRQTLEPRGVSAVHRFF
jgi:hypothetical protein